MSISSHAKHGPNNGRSMPTGDLALDIKPNDPAASSEEEQIAFVRALRVQTAERYREVFKTATAPIRVMARMMHEVMAEARRAGIPAEILRRELSNRTIGDVNVRMITEKIDGVDYSTIGEDLGLILPGRDWRPDQRRCCPPRIEQARGRNRAPLAPRLQLGHARL